MNQQINFKKVFTIFFVALGLFTVVGISVGVWGGIADSRLLERLMLTGFRERIFSDPLVAFRSIGYLFLIAFNAILALWVYVDGKKHNKHKALWPAFTLLTGLIGWLIYLISRKDNTKIESREETRGCQ